MKEKFLHCWLTASPPPSGFFVTKVLQPSFKTAAFSGDEERETREIAEKCPEKRQIQIQKAFSLISTIHQNFFVYCANLLLWLGGNVIKIKKNTIRNGGSTMLCPTYTVYTAFTVYTVYTFKLLYAGQAWSAYNSTWLCDLCMVMNGWSEWVRLLWLLEHLRC